MTARKWGNALENAETSPSEEIKALRRLLVEKGVLTDEEANRGTGAATKTKNR